MKLLIDTNIVMDVLCSREKFVAASSEILKRCEIKSIDGNISALSIPNIVYIMRKEITKEKVSETISKLLYIFNVADLMSIDLQSAAESEISDFEDAIQAVTARRIKADYIVTRNIKDFKASPVPPITPEAFLQKYPL